VTGVQTCALPIFKFTAQYIKYRDDNGTFVANDNYYLLNKNDVQPSKQHPYNQDIITQCVFERCLTKNEQSYQNSLNFMDNPNSSLQVFYMLKKDN
jgi:hypothetical protein